MGPQERRELGLGRGAIFGAIRGAIFGAVRGAIIDRLHPAPATVRLAGPHATVRLAGPARERRYH